jgi:hypothetical protein
MPHLVNRTDTRTDTGLISQVSPKATLKHPSQIKRERQWPDYERCLLEAPRSSTGDSPDRSLADYFFCKMAAQHGWSVEETEQKLLEVSEKARERARCGDEGYAHVTALNAAAEGRRRGRGG